jgi:hypothetical protein
MEQQMWMRNRLGWMQQTALVFAMLAIGGLAHAQGFSADGVDSSARSGTPKRNRVFGQNDKMRLETYDDPASPEPSGIVLTDFAQQTALVVFPAQRLYMDIGASKVGFANPMVWQLFRPDSVEDACGGWLKIAAEHGTQMTCKKIGAEAINGRSTAKYQIGGTQSGFLWVDQQLRILLKMEAGGIHLELKNVREGLQSPNLFEIPAGYQRMDVAVKQALANRDTYLDEASGRNHHEESGMHACKQGYAMLGVQIDDNVFLCRQVSNDTSSEESKVDGDPATQRNGMHACPAGWYVRGLRAPSLFHRSKNWLLCSRTASVALGDEGKSEPWTSPSCPWKDILSCPADMQGCPNDRPVMTGMNLALSQSNSAFLCAKIVQ